MATSQGFAYDAVGNRQSNTLNGTATIYTSATTELAVDILGADALYTEGRPPSSAFQCDDPGAANSSASWVGTFLNARAGTIYAGSSQIQRNIIGEMILQLPKEPKPA